MDVMQAGGATTLCEVFVFFSPGQKGGEMGRWGQISSGMSPPTKKGKKMRAKNGLPRREILCFEGK